MSFIVRWLEGGMSVVDHRLRIFSKYTAVSTTENLWAYHPVDEYYYLYESGAVIYRGFGDTFISGTSIDASSTLPIVNEEPVEFITAMSHRYLDEDIIKVFNKQAMLHPGVRIYLRDRRVGIPLNRAGSLFAYTTKLTRRDTPWKQSYGYME